MANYKTPEDELSDLFVTNIDNVDQFVTGELYTWGNNSLGTLGRSNLVSSISPVQIGTINDWIDVTSGRVTMAGIRADSSLWTWGYGAEGRLGDGTAVSKSSPVQISTGWKQIAANDSVLGIKLDGTLWAWGYGGNGCIGNNSTSNISSPVQTAIGGVWKYLAAGVEHVAAIKEDGSLYTWGQNTNGGLGTNDTIHRSIPIQTIAGGFSWKQVSCGWLHTAAIKNNGTLWTWGQNTYGQLGDNSTTHRSSPVQTIVGGSNWKKVVAGYQSTYGLKTDGTLWAWGRNDYGSLGDSTLVHRSSPVQIGSDFKDICESISLAVGVIRNDGTLWAWGAANTVSAGGVTINDRSVGDGSFAHRSSPVQVLQIGSTWKKAVYSIYGNAMIVTKE
jgi:alpha-tubulin suppressor-like RCC1 family protein